MSTTTQQTDAERLGLLNPPEQGMWEPWTPTDLGEPLKMLLEEVGTFVLLAASVREGIVTQYGVRAAVDLTVATKSPGEVRTFSGFAVGIVGQVKRKAEGNLPALVKIVEQDTGKGKPTQVLEPIGILPPGATPEAIAAIAAQLPVSLGPIERSAQTNEIPY